MAQVLGESLSLRRFLMLLIGIFAGIALLLGLVGVYGVIAYLVGQRRQELAIRVALGATRSEIVWLVVRRGLFLASAGVTLGLAASVALSRVLVGTLFGVSSLDPLTYVLAPALLFTVVVAASSLPALRCDPPPGNRGVEGRVRPGARRFVARAAAEPRYLR